MSKNFRIKMATLIALNLALCATVPATFANESTKLDQNIDTWDSNNGNQLLVQNPFNDDDESDYIVKVIGEPDNMGNVRYTFDEEVSGETITMSFKLLAEDIEQFTGGINMFAGGNEADNQFCRIKFDTGRIRYSNSGGITTTLVNNAIGNDQWYDITIVHYIEDGELSFDIYINGVLQNTVPLQSKTFDNATPVNGDNITMSSFTLFTDSSCDATLYYDEVEVKVGTHIPDESEPISPFTFLEEDNWESASIEIGPYRYQDENNDHVLIVDTGSNIYNNLSHIERDKVTLNYKMLLTDELTVGGLQTDLFTLHVIGTQLVDEHANVLANNLRTNVWHDISIVHTAKNGDITADVYLNGIKIASGLELGEGDTVTIDYLDFFGDERSQGQFLYNEITVRNAELIPVASTPVQPLRVDDETPKPTLPSELPELQEPFDVADLPLNIYKSGLNGHEILAPDSATGNMIDITTYLSDIKEGEDVTAAVQQAIDEASYGDTIYFPDGEYNFITDLTNVIILKSGVSLLGESEEGTILKVENPGTSSNVYFMRADGQSNFSIKNLTLTSTYYGEFPGAEVYGDLSANKTRNGNMTHGIYFESSDGIPCSQIEVENVTIEVFKTMALSIRNSQDVRVTGCTFQHPTDVGGGGAGYGVAIQGTVNQNNLGQDHDSMHNIIEECTFIGLRHGILLQYWTHNNLVINNMLYGCGYGAIDLHGEDEYLNEVAYNTVYDTHWGGGIEVGNSGSGHDEAGPLNYIHNNIVDGGLRGIDVEFGTPDTIVENNTVSNIYSMSDGNGGGIRVKNALRTIVRNNTLFDNRYGVVFAEDSGYTYNGIDGWGSGIPVQTEIYNNNLSGNLEDYYFPVGEQNIVDGYDADGTIVVEQSSNAHLIALIAAETEFAQPFLPDSTNYNIYLTGSTLTLTPYTSAKEVSSITIDGTAAISGEPITLSFDTDETIDTVIEIVVVSQDGKNTMTYDILARLNVDENYIPVSGVASMGEAPVIEENTPYKLGVGVLPANASEQSLTYEIVSGEDVLSIDTDGNVTTLSAGKAYITATSVDNPAQSAEIMVIVTPEIDKEANKLSITDAWASDENEGNEVALAVDDDLSSRWAGQSTDIGSEITPVTLTVELEQEALLTHAQISWNSGDARNYQFKILVSADNENWTEVFDGASSGLTAGLEAIVFDEPTAGKYVTYEGRGSIVTATDAVNLWNSIFELEVYGK
ncbi:MAG: hypothetical protein BEN18_05815 [Epulopiscium sp. Nuni2H_MBin001]|nr:MAG: hypothetical protein BEN18_05815 [Epulopiscium sp. Nuni2H_MBin001]